MLIVSKLDLISQLSMLSLDEFIYYIKVSGKLSQLQILLIQQDVLYSTKIFDSRCNLIELILNLLF